MFQIIIQEHRQKYSYKLAWDGFIFAVTTKTFSNNVEAEEAGKNKLKELFENWRIIYS